MSRFVASAIEAALEGDSPGFDHDEPHHRNRHRGLKAMAAGAALVGAVQVVRSQAPKLSKLDALTTLGKVTQLPDMVRDVPDRLRDRVADTGLLHDDAEPEDVADDDEIEQDEDLDEDENEELEDEEEEPPEDEGEAEPEADLEDEAEDEEAEDEQPEGEEPADEEPEDEEPEDEGDGPGDEGDDWPDDEDDEGGGGDAADPETDPETVGAIHRAAAVEQAKQGLGIEPNGDRSSASGATPDVIQMLSAHRPPPLLTRTDDTREIDPVARPPEPPTKESSSEPGPSRSDRSGGSTSRSGSSKSRSGTSKSQSGGSKSRSTRAKSGSAKSGSAKSGSARSGSAKAGASRSKSGKSSSTRSSSKKKAKAGSK